MMPAPYDSMFEKDYFSKGLAVGEARILTDTIYFRFRNEEFEYPARDIHHLVDYDPSAFMTMRVHDLRAFRKKKGNGHG